MVCTTASTEPLRTGASGVEGSTDHNGRWSVYDSPFDRRAARLSTDCGTVDIRQEHPQVAAQFDGIEACLCQVPCQTGVVETVKIRHHLVGGTPEGQGLPVALP